MLRIEKISFAERRKNKIELQWLVVAVLFVWGCQEPVQVDRKKIMDEYVQQKLHDYESLRNASCKKEAYQIATKEVDSLLIARAKMNRNREDKPVVPPKPKKPTIMQPLDSSAVKPIIE